MKNTADGKIKLRGKCYQDQIGKEEAIRLAQSNASKLWMKTEEGKELLRMGKEKAEKKEDILIRGIKVLKR
jgi:hypothetical protein